MNPGAKKSRDFLILFLLSSAWTAIAVWFFLFSPMQVGAKRSQLAPGVYCTGACPGLHQSIPLAEFAMFILPIVDRLLLPMVWGALLGLDSGTRAMRADIPSVLLMSLIWMGLYAGIFWLA